jgi:hypothetical protein
MKHVIHPTTARLAALPAVAALLLGGCGGGGGGGSAPVQAPAATPAATPAAAPAAPGSSTALKDNTASSSANFSNFVSGKVSVPVEGVAFAGSRRFVKVARADGAVLFLGEVAPGMPFAITVDAPRGQRRFAYEIFSESAVDQIVRGEVIL